jgi:predicted phage-related endonuclease
VACLYGNNDNEFVYRTIDRDLDFEADMIEQEKFFWYDYVQAGVEPPYTETGELVLASIRKYKGAADKSASTVVLDPTLASAIQKYLELREIKLTHEREAKKLDEELKTVMVPVYDKMGVSCLATCRKDGVEYSITYNPTYRKSISTADLERLETLHKNIYDDFVTKSESRRVSVKQRTL